MPNYGITGQIMAWLAGLPVGTVITLTSAEESTGLRRAQVASTLLQLSKVGTIRKESGGVYRVTETTVGRAAVETAADAPAAPRVTAPTPAPVPAATRAVVPPEWPPVVLLNIVRPVGADAIYADDTSGAVYKVVRIA